MSSFFSKVGKVAGNVGKTVVKAAKDTERATVKGVVDTGHAAGKAADSKIGKIVIGAGLAASGIGLVPAVLAGAAVEGTAKAIKPGGNFHTALVGVEQGAVTGAVSAVAGTAVRSISNGTGLGGFKSALLKGKDAFSNLHPSTATPTPAIEAIHPVDTMSSGDASPMPTELTPSGIAKVTPKQTIVDKFLTHVTADPVKGTPVDTHKASRANGATHRETSNGAGTGGAVTPASANSVTDNAGGGLPLAPVATPSGNKSIYIAGGLIGTAILAAVVFGRKAA